MLIMNLLFGNIKIVHKTTYSEIKTNRKMGNILPVFYKQIEINKQKKTKII